MEVKPTTGLKYITEKLSAEWMLNIKLKSVEWLLIKNLT